MTDKRRLTTAQRLDESQTAKNKTIRRYQVQNDNLKATFQMMQDDIQKFSQALRDTREGIRNLRFVVALLVVGLGLSVGLLLSVLR